ncbi:hypothetical protein FB451DRAFT_1225843 [Mycena latifolia]|nr:hypothetical protein FB451DRAFT_1225843 [Mycena latifolia]
MAALLDPDANIVRDVIVYPAAGGTPRITPMHFSAKEGATASPADCFDLDLVSLYGPESIWTTREKSWSVGDGPNRMAYMLCYNMDPGLPPNLAMARLVSADPSNPGERLLWRGDVCVVRVLPEGSNPDGTLGKHYLNVTTEGMDLLNSTLIPCWYNSFEWRNFLHYEENMHKLFLLTEGIHRTLPVELNANLTLNDESSRAFNGMSDSLNFRLYTSWNGHPDRMVRLLQQLKAIVSEQLETVMAARTPKFRRDPYEATSRKVLLYPASESAQPHIVPMIFAERDTQACPLAFEMIDIDIPGLYGQENIFAARQKLWGFTSSDCGELESNEQYTLYYNLNPDLPVNRTMARLVGVNPEWPCKRPLWRGDVVVVKSRYWPKEHPDYVDITPDVINRFNSHLIPQWFNSDEWRDLLDREEDFNEDAMRPGSWLNPWNVFLWLIGDNSRQDSRALYEKRTQLIERLRAISATASNSDGGVQTHRRH